MTDEKKLSAADLSQFLAWKEEQDERARTEGAYCLTPEGRASIRDIWEGDSGSWVTVLLDEVERLEAVIAAAPSAAPAAPAEGEREALRAGQAAAVMPMIGPLLDAWEAGSSALRDEHPEVDKWLRKINRAMEDAAPAAQPVQPSAAPAQAAGDAQ